MKINTFDVERVTLKDYSMIRTERRRTARLRSRRFDADVTWDADQNQWLLDDLIQYRNGRPAPTELLDTEELNAQTQ